MPGPRPCPPSSAVARALQLLSEPTNKTTGYQLGTGDYHAQLPDLPWTGNNGAIGSDCAGFICWCYELVRHRPGFNVGGWATVSHDINTDSACEDADHMRELFAPVVDAPQLGDLLIYATVPRIGEAGPWMGHVSIVLDASQWNPLSWASLRVAQCCGPNGRMPAVIATDGSIWDHHDATWPTHRSRLLRVVP